MFKLGDRLPRWAVLVTAMLWATTALACNVPVFRYALERWAADPYELIVFHRGSLSSDESGWLAGLEKTPAGDVANVAVKRIDLEGDMSATNRALWNAQVNPAPPWLIVQYPRHARIERPVWTGPLSQETVRNLIESPARRELIERLSRGDSIVWLLLEGGDQRRDNDAARVVEAESRELERTLVLPKLTPLDPPTNPDLPLKIAFSTMRVSRSNAAERWLVNLLVNWNTNLITSTEPMLFPVFGRGRVVPPATGPEIRPEAIREMAEFLTGPCSCEIKEMNPGYDLLLAANWDGLIGDRRLTASDLPPLMGLSQFATSATNRPPTSDKPDPAALAQAKGAGFVPERGSLLLNVAVVLALAVVFVTAATLAIRLKARRGSR